MKSKKTDQEKILSFAGSLKNADLDSIRRIRKEINSDWEKS